MFYKETLRKPLLVIPLVEFWCLLNRFFKKDSSVDVKKSSMSLFLWKRTILSHLPRFMFQVAQNEWKLNILKPILLGKSEPISLGVFVYQRSSTQSTFCHRTPWGPSSWMTSLYNWKPSRLKRKTCKESCGILLGLCPPTLLLGDGSCGGGCGGGCGGVGSCCCGGGGGCGGCGGSCGCLAAATVVSLD